MSDIKTKEPPTIQRGECIRKSKKVYFSGVSGCYYPFKYFSLTDEFPEAAAVYIFTRSQNGSNEPLYIGETGTLKSTIRDHEKWVCVCRMFVNTLYVHFEKDAAVRQQIVDNLIKRQRPPCND